MTCPSSNWSAEKLVVVEVNAMSGPLRKSKAERVGRWLARAYRGLLRQEQRLRLWLVEFGVPATGARVFAWCLRFSVIVLLLSFSIVLAMIVLGLWLIGRGVARSDLSYRTPDVEWRDGPSGYGMYTDDGYRIDPHVHEDL
ncbi:DUF3742 family protein [Pseudomonas poae]|uniref:DUF3742 family protein n=2 Tax=Pseudomonas poae TaxID=200451 RepID=A0AAP2S2F7_9PSED|nr:DUF3742 family protein [Pseudomonas poae]